MSLFGDVGLFEYNVARHLPVEKNMKFLKKAVVAAAAFSMAIAPVAASAAPAQFDDLRADTTVSGLAIGEDGGSATWLFALLGGLAVIAGIVIAAGGSSNAPTSP